MKFAGNDNASRNSAARGIDSAASVRLSEPGPASRSEREGNRDFVQQLRMAQVQIEKLNQVWRLDFPDAKLLAESGADMARELSQLAKRARCSARRLSEGDLEELLSVICDLYRLECFSATQNRLKLQLLHAEVLMLGGCWLKAEKILQPLIEESAILIESRETLSRLLILDTQISLAMGAFQKVEAVALRRLLFVARSDPKKCRVAFDDMAPALAAINQKGAPSMIGKILRHLARARILARSRGIVFLRITSRRWLRMHTYQFLSALISTCAVLLLRASAKAEPSDHLRRDGSEKECAQHVTHRSPSMLRRRILISRAMGGLGDLLAMTPGLAAAREALGADIFFATQVRYFPLLQGVPGLQLLDIEAPIDSSNFDQCLDFSDCPASAYERRVLPRVRLSRVESFAYALGLSREDLRKQGLRPILSLTRVQAELSSRRRREWSGKATATVIGIQPFSKDHYKSVPQLTKLLSSIVGSYRFVVFSDQVRALPDDPRFVGCFGESYEEAIAAADACDYIITVDSFFLHLAAALDKPVLALFGPTDADAFARHVRRKVVIQMKERFPCSPCWRNEQSRCLIFDQWASVCLDSVSQIEIQEGLRILEESYPRAA